MWKLMAEGQPTLFPNGTIDETVPRRTWEQSGAFDDGGVACPA